MRDLVPEESDSFEIGIRGDIGNFSYIWPPIAVIMTTSSRSLTSEPMNWDLVVFR